MFVDASETAARLSALQVKVDMLEQAMMDHHRVCANRTWYLICMGIAVIGFLIVKVMGW